MKTLSKLFLSAILMIATSLTVTAQVKQYTQGDKVVTDDGVFVVKGNNLISNPSFDEGTVGWMGGNGQDISDSYFDVPQTGGADGGPYLKALNSAGSSAAQSIKTGWEISTNTKYMLHFYALRPAVDGNAQYSRVYLGTSATSTSSQIASVKYTAGTWQENTVVFDSGEYSYCIANFGWLGNGCGFDCFELYQLEQSAELVYTKLEEQISAAQTLISTTTEGTGAGQYTTAVRDALTSAISDAEGILNSATSQTQINDAIAALKTACTTYSNNVNPPFDIKKQYNLVHYSQKTFVMTSGGDGGTVKITDEDVSDKTQVFSFVKAPTNDYVGYNLIDAEGNYVYRQGSWDTKASSTQDATVANAIYQIVDLGDGVIQLKNMGSGSVLGTDNTGSGSTVYSNKNGGDARYKWILKEYIPADQRDAEYNFNLLLTKAENVYSSVSTDNLGNGVFQYSKSAYETFGAAIATAKTMSDFSAAADYLQSALDEYEANSVNTPDPAADYIITQSAGNSVAYEEDNALATLTSEPQSFHIIAAETAGAFYLQNKESGMYLAKSPSSAWNTSWVEEKGTKEAQWYIAAYGESAYTIQNVAGKGYLGSDATSEGSSLYCDKAASAANSHWTIMERSVSAIIGAVIEKAENILAQTEVGTEYYQVPQSAVDVLREAIADARDAISSASIEDATQIASSLQDAIDEFNASFNPMNEFDTSLSYYILHYGGNLLTSTASGNAKLTAMGEEGKPNDEQKIYLESAGEEFTYYIRSAEDTYLTLDGDYNTKWIAEKNEECIFRIDQLKGKYLGIYNVSKRAYFGTDATAVGSLVYSDKSAVANSYWTIESFDDITFDKTLWTAALEKVQTFRSEMVQGRMPGEYLSEVITEYASVVSQYQSKAKKAQSQEELDLLAAELEATIETFKAKANIVEVIIKTALASALTSAEKTLASAQVGDCNGNYPQSAVDVYQKVIDDAKNVNLSESSSQAEVDAATASLKEAATAFAAEKVVINFDQLKSVIATAQQTISDNTKYKGEGPGTYPSSAFDALQSAIDAAKKHVNSTTDNQSAITAEYMTLSEAIATFKSAWVDFDFTELKRLLDALNDFKNTTTILLDEEDTEALNHAISVGNDALSATLQSDIDKAVRLLSREYSYFTELSTAINSVLAGTSNGNIHIYTLSGTQIPTLRPGINIVRYKNSIVKLYK